MKKVFNKPLELLHGFLHSRDMVKVDVTERPLVPNSTAFESYIDCFHHNCRENIRWMGKKASKFPSDAWILQEIIYETKPDVIVEIGNLFGGSTLFLANMLDILGKGRVIAIDIDHSLVDFEHQRIARITGDANSSTVLSKVRHLIGPTETAMVVEDSSHTFKNTLSVLRNYSRFVKKGMYFIVEDGICRYPFIEDGPKPGPYEAVHEFLRENEDFVIDKTREKFILTYNPDGYLKRVR